MILTMLAEVPTAWIIGFPVAVFVLQIVQGAIMLSLQSKTKKIDTLESDMSRVTAQVIETKLGAVRSDLSGPIIEMRTRVKQVEERLNAGDRHFKDSDERSHKLEVKILESLQGLKDNMATKDDLNRLREEWKRA